MIHYYCDICKVELPDSGFTSQRLKGKALIFGEIPINIEVICGVRGWNDGQICGPCLQSALSYAFEHDLRDYR